MTRTGTTDITETIVSFIVDTNIKDVSALGRDRAVAAISDAIGAAIAGGSTDIAALVLAALNDAGQLAGDHLLLGTRLTGGALDAALFNGTAAHALEYDDVNHPGPMHPSCHIVPALLALSPMRPVSGADIVLSYIIGFEIDAKLSRVLSRRHYDRGWHATSTIGTVAAAAAGAKLLDLSADAASNCIAIAASSAAGLRGNFGSMVKPLHAGAAARAAVEAALLASRGFTGAGKILERRYGYLDAFGDDIGERADTFAELGRTWDIDSEFGIGLKPYPCCGEATAAIEAALRLAPTVIISDIRRIVVSTNEQATRILTFASPANIEEARFSLPFCVATALAHGRADLDAFSAAALTNDAVRTLIPIVHHEVSLQHRDEREYGANVDITLDSGQHIELEVPVTKGWAHRWLTDDEQLLKFLRCAQESYAPSAARELHELLAALETLPDFAAVTSRLNPRLSS